MGARKRLSKQSQVTVTVPLVMERDDSARPEWRAQAVSAGGELLPIAVYGADSESAARQGVAALIAETLSRVVAANPIMVVGGSADYAPCVHLICATPGGHNVYVVREGRAGCSWDDEELDSEKMLARVLAHVGGDPLVVRF